MRPRIGCARRWFGSRTRNKLGTEHPKTGSNTVEQGACKSIRSRDGGLFCVAHNPKGGDSDPFAQSRPPTSLLQVRAEANFLPVPWVAKTVTEILGTSILGAKTLPQLSNADRYMADAGAGCPRKSPKFRLASGKACLVNSLGERCSDS